MIKRINSILNKYTITKTLTLETSKFQQFYFIIVTFETLLNFVIVLLKKKTYFATVKLISAITLKKNF